jgi:outer membrane immunogenic protein
MRAFIAAAGLFLAATHQTWAADLPPGPAPAPPQVYAPAAVPAHYNWTSLYIGGNAGWGFATASATATLGALSATASEDLSGFVGGGQVGFNYQFGVAVIGIEADFDASTQSTSTTSGVLTATDQIPWLATVRGRVGAAFDRVLIYTTGGFGYGEFKSTVTATGFGSASASQSHGAWTVGGGVEVGITNNLSGRIEYLYLDTGNIPLATIGALGITGRVQDNIVRAGLNFRLPL